MGWFSRFSNWPLTTLRSSPAFSALTVKWGVPFCQSICSNPTTSMAGTPKNTSSGPTCEPARRCNGAGRARASKLAAFREVDRRYFRRERAIVLCSQRWLVSYQPQPPEVSKLFVWSTERKTPMAPLENGELYRLLGVYFRTWKWYVDCVRRMRPKRSTFSLAPRQVPGTPPLSINIVSIRDDDSTCANVCHCKHCG